jgi:hypothetical protein
MVQAVQAKMIVENISEYFYKQPGSDEVKTSGKQVKLKAVYSNNPDSPNYSFSKATPSADLSMFISNPEAFAYFEGGGEYLLTFEKVVPQENG